MQTSHALRGPRTPHSAPRRRTAAVGLAALATAALALLPALPASAHDELVSATPAAGSTVTAAPATVALTFSAALLDLGGRRNGIEVTDAAGRHFETACATVAGDELTSPVSLGAAGTYSVAWRGVSADGHDVADVYTFRYRPAAGTPAAAGSATGPSCGGTASSGAPTASAAGSSPQLPGGAILTGAVSGAVLLAALAAVLVVVLRLRRAKDGEEQR